MSSEKQRRRFEAKEKLALLKRHLVDGEKISDICQQNNINPNQFYRWQAELFENQSAFSANKSPNTENKTIQRLKEEINLLQKRVDHKDSVIAEITEDYVRVKKNSSAI